MVCIPEQVIVRTSKTIVTIDDCGLDGLTLSYINHQRLLFNLNIEMFPVLNCNEVVECQLSVCGLIFVILAELRTVLIVVSAE